MNMDENITSPPAPNNSLPLSQNHTVEVHSAWEQRMCHQHNQQTLRWQKICLCRQRNLFFHHLNPQNSVMHNHKPPKQLKEQRRLNQLIMFTLKRESVPWSWWTRWSQDEVTWSYTNYQVEQPLIMNDLKLISCDFFSTLQSLNC